MNHAKERNRDLADEAPQLRDAAGAADAAAAGDPVPPRDGDPAARPRGPRVHASPADVMSQMSPPGCRMYIDFNQHRFQAKFGATSDTWEDAGILRQKHFNRTFTRADWQEKLSQVHDWAWRKWELARAEAAFALSEGRVAQAPGHVAPAVLEALEPVIRDIGERKKYKRGG